MRCRGQAGPKELGPPDSRLNLAPDERTTVVRPVVVKFIAIAFILLSTLAACGGSQHYKQVTLSKAETSAPSRPLGTGKTPLRVAIAAVISPKETRRSYDDLLAFLGDKVGRPVEIVQRQTYAEVNDLIRSGNIDLAFVCTKAYVDGQQDFGMELLVAPEVRGETVYYSYIIVPKDSDAKSLADLRGKTFAFTDPLSNSGRLAPAYMLWQMGETPDSFFKKFTYTYSHDNSIKAVAEKVVDGAAVDSLVYDYSVARSPQYASRTKIIDKSLSFGTPPVVVPPSLSPELKQDLRDIFLSMHEDPMGKTILQNLMIDRFVVPDDHAYDSVREMSARLGVSK